MSRFIAQPDGATPLTAEDVEGLKPSWVSTQGELNQAEAENILRGRLWASRARRPPFWYLLDTGLKDLHQAMLGDVWAWAGHTRHRETNIGIDPHQIPVALRGTELTSHTSLRNDHLTALRHADNNLDFTALIEFARRLN